MARHLNRLIGRCCLAASVGMLLPTACGTSNGTGSGDSTGTTTPEQQQTTPPVANAGPDQTALAGQAVTLNGGSSTGTGLSYAWAQTSGDSVAMSGQNSAQATFTAPALASQMTLGFRLTVTDSAGRSATDDASVIVVATNSGAALAANAGADQAVREGTLVTLSGAAINAGTDSITYAWTQRSGPVVQLSDSSAARPTFVAPQVGANTTLTFRLSVRNSRGTAATDDVDISVVDVSVTANAGNDQNVPEGATVTLSGSAHDPAGKAINYSWTQIAGPTQNLSGAGNSLATFTAPLVGATPMTLTFRLTASNSDGISGTDDVNVMVVDHAPIAKAGADQTTSENSTVMLDGSGTTDAENEVLSYSWTQTGGPTVALANANSAHASFVAPVTSSIVTLAFRLTAQDPGGLTGIADTRVTVTNSTPVANAGVDQAVNEGSTVTLDGRSSSDSDPADQLSYSWTQLAGPTVVLNTANPARPTFTAPSVLSQKLLTFQLNVTDLGGLVGGDTVNVTVSDVDGNGGPATIAVMPATLTPSFRSGRLLPAPVLNISALGLGTVHYTITTSTVSGGNWLTVAQPMGFVDVGSNAAVAVTLSGALSPGVYSGLITITDQAAANSPVTVPVTYTVLDAQNPAPTIDISKDALIVYGSGAGGADPSFPQPIVVRNSGDGLLNYSITSDQPWVQISPPSGTADQAGQTVQASFAGAGALAVGTHTATLTISAAGATNDPQHVTVTITHPVRFYGVLRNGLHSPNRLALDASSNLYVSNAAVAPAVMKLSRQSGAILQVFAGNLVSPTGMAVANNGTVYVADVVQNKIVVYDSTGLFAMAWGGTGTESGKFNSCVDVALDASGNVYVADEGNERVQVFDGTGHYLSEYSVTALCGGLPHNYAAASVVLIPPNQVLVSSAILTGNRCTGQSGMFRYGSHGEFLGAAYTPWAGPYTNQINDVAADSAGNCYIGNVHFNWPATYSAFNCVATYANPARAVPFSEYATSPPTADGRMADCTGMLIDGDGYLYATDFFGGQILKFGP